MRTQQSAPRHIVHLELHTGDRARASTFYERLLQHEFPDSTDNGRRPHPGAGIVRPCRRSDPAVLAKRPKSSAAQRAQLGATDAGS